MSGSKSFTGSNAEVSYQFTHLTAQEFLAAWYSAIVLSAEEQNKLFIEKAGDDRFRMMLLFLAGITGLQDTQVYQQILHKSYQQLQQELLQPQEQKVQEQELLRQQIGKHQLQQLQDMEQQRQQIELEIKLEENLFYLSHCIYESQNVSLSPILARAVQRDGKMGFSFSKYDLFQCTVIAYFLSTCNFPWKHLVLDGVTDEKMEIMQRVFCEHTGSSNVRGARNINAANPPPFLKDTKELSLGYEFDVNAPPPKPTSFSYLLNMKPTSSLVSFHNVAMCTKYCSILFNILTHHKTLQRLEIMIVEGCALDMKECEDLQEMLQTNTSIQYLKIGWNSLSDQAAEHIAAGLVHNHSLKKLDISGNNITSVGATSIFRALVSNTTLESLNMSFNKLHYTLLSPSLLTSRNTSLLSPSSQLLAQPIPALSTTHCQPLSPSPIPHDGAAMAEMLSHNSTLTELNISHCGLTPQSCVYVFSALKHNSSLKKLDITDTTFDKAVSEALADMLSHNITLTFQSVASLPSPVCSCSQH